ncbi:MAG: hypothetical protein WAK07_09170, partial [Rhodomicrobium sp.]
LTTRRSAFTAAAPSHEIGRGRGNLQSRIRAANKKEKWAAMLVSHRLVKLCCCDLQNCRNADWRGNAY